MRISVHAVGRMKSGPERELAARYFDRFSKAATPLGLSFAQLIEPPESRARDTGQRCREEAAKLHALGNAGARIVALDETGKALTSPGFADLLAHERDAGTRDLVFAIGGADGHDPDILAKAAATISFGRMTWPHQLARIMLSEQLYRAATILAGHPYHRA